MKKCLFVATFIIISVAASYNAFAESWYTQVTKDHARPTLPDMELLADNGGVALGPDVPKVYLTFDAGYENGNVRRVAQVLKDNGVNGAFFILSNIVETDPELIRSLSEDGNLICNHTRRHPDMSTKGEEDFKRELLSMEEYYRDKTGSELAKFYRPPEGKYNADNLKWASELGYKTVFWSVAYRDWDNDNQMPPEKALNILLSRVHNGAVILLHPTSRTNADILDEFIKTVKSMGYEFGLINEL